MTQAKAKARANKTYIIQLQSSQYFYSKGHSISNEGYIASTTVMML
jgi:hypothetical protein